MVNSRGFHVKLNRNVLLSAELSVQKNKFWRLLVRFRVDTFHIEKHLMLSLTKGQVNT